MAGEVPKALAVTSAWGSVTATCRPVADDHRTRDSVAVTENRGPAIGRIDRDL